MTRSLLALAAAVTAIAAGIALGALLFRPAVPRGLDEAPAVVDTPVAERALDDRRTVSLALDLGPSTALKSPADGLVTAFHCRPGQAVSSGDHLMTVGDQRVYALATDAPLWRDLGPGDTGDDVADLQEELQRLGYPLAVDGEVGPRTLRAAADLVGLVDPASIRAYTTIPRASFVWLPAASVVPVSCTASVGDGVNEHDDLAALERPLVRAQIVAMPDDLLPGPRRLTVDGQDLPVDDSGAVDDPDALERLRTTPSYQRWLAGLADDPASALDAALGLVDPAVVSSVSPSAIYDIDGAAACVLDNGAPRPVTIVSSELGQTHVVFPDGRPAPLSLPASTRTGPPCR
ncbi:hypothetical protein M3T53_08675 [Actinomyces sp. B33]|uniref:putative peptidoglycan-binding domain-containing protein n=1 Tax=Actinomyces sp. B33 TaxID=2942131 RepID=UPI0023419786|nr:putative peptidoglycan-binding domain-containing protein [Actinomyces sp. B33]MDC4233775.1 hypothetical protein [Actinomyces sp. B33]